MAGNPWESSGEARRALHGIVTDPHYGAAALSQPAVMSNLLKDLLPDQPREAGLLVAAAQADLAGSLRGYVSQGLDLATAASLTAATFVSNTSHTPEACTWVVTELALALGLATDGQLHTPPMAAQQPEAAPLSQQTLPRPGLGASQDPAVLAPAGPAKHKPLQPPAQAAHAGQAGQPAPAAWQPPGWQQPVWQPASHPRPARPRALLSAGITGLAGALFVLLGATLPWTRSPGQPSFSIFGGFKGATFNEVFWFALEPAGVIVATVIVSIVLMTRGRSGFAAGLLTGVGIQTVLLFIGYTLSISPPSTHQAGGPLGLVGGAAVLLAGLVARTAKDTAQAWGAGAAPAPGAVSPAQR